jgi:hypothetical protein
MTVKKRDYTTLSISRATQEKLGKIKLKILKERGDIVPLTRIIDELADKALK